MRLYELSIVKWLLLQPRLVKQFTFIILDIFLSLLCVVLAFYLRLGEWQSITVPIISVTLISVVVSVPIFILLGLYRQIFRYGGISSFPLIFRANFYYSLIFIPLIFIIKIEGVPRTIGLLHPLLFLIAVLLSRIAASHCLSFAFIPKSACQVNVLVYGAGISGRHVVNLLSKSDNFNVVGYIDDDVSLHGRMINNIPVYDPHHIESKIRLLNVKNILLAMPSLDKSKRKKLIDKFLGFNVGVKTVPSISEIANGRVNISDIRELDYDDLLGRDAVSADFQLLEKNIVGKTVLVTGAGGSIGSELCRQIIKFSPRRLLLLELNEFSLYNIVEELTSNDADVRLLPILGSVLDAIKVNEVLETWTPNVIFHAAAYKHVSLVELNPSEGIKNNVYGTLCLVEAANKFKIQNFVLISTDKAVRPTNIMGASKRLAELILQAYASVSKNTTYSMVRFGNVLGSSGSVVPKFRQQIKLGGPVTVTDRSITRYFMTIPEAAQLVIQASSLAKGGDVFLLDMGEPVKIYDLARRMIELSGLTIKEQCNPTGDIEIIFDGLKTGEKLYEELLIDSDAVPTVHSSILRANEDFWELADLQEVLDKLWLSVQKNDILEIREILLQVVNGYNAAEKIVDLKYNHI